MSKITTSKTWRVGEDYGENISLTIDNGASFARIRATRDGYDSFSADLKSLMAVRCMLDAAIAEIEAAAEPW